MIIALSLFIFFLGLFCIFKARHLIQLLIGIECILNAAVLLFVFFAKDGHGYLNAILISCIGGIMFVIYLNVFKKYYDEEDNTLI